VYKWTENRSFYGHVIVTYCLTCTVCLTNASTDALLLCVCLKYTYIKYTVVSTHFNIIKILGWAGIKLTSFVFGPVLDQFQAYFFGQFEISLLDQF